MTHLGLIGTGRMGGPMAMRLLDAGPELSVFDRSEAALTPLLARGARRGASAAEMASRAEIVLASLVKTVEEWAGVEVGG